MIFAFGLDEPGEHSAAVKQKQRAVPLLPCPGLPQRIHEPHLDLSGFPLAEGLPPTVVDDDWFIVKNRIYSNNLPNPVTGGLVGSLPTGIGTHFSFSAT